MESLSSSVQSGCQITIPFQKFLRNQEDIEQYRKLVNNIFEIWNEGKNLKSQQRSVIWEKIFFEINQYNYDEKTNSNNFYRCLTTGALLFTLDSKNKYIFINFTIIQKLFQLFPHNISQSTIFKKFKKPLEFDEKQFSILHHFQKFLDFFVELFPESNCNFGWLFYEIKNELKDIVLAKSDLLLDHNDSNQQILDFIMDDNADFFSQSIKQKLIKGQIANQIFFLSNYKLPNILSDFPSFASLCCFFGAEKCLSVLCDFIEGGLESDEIKKPDSRGRSCIHFACAGGNTKIVNKLVEAGFDINAKDLYSMTPSHYSAMHGTLSVFKFLLKEGADIFSIDSLNSMTSLHLASYYGNFKIIELADKEINISEFLRDDFSNTDLNSRNCLFLSCRSGNDKTVKYLLLKIKEIENELNDVNDLLFSSLLISCQTGMVNCIKLLLDYNNEFKNSIRGNEKAALLNEAVLSGSKCNVINFLSRCGIINEPKSKEEKYYFNIKWPGLNHEKEIDKNFNEMLSGYEKNQFDYICSLYQKKPRLTSKNYYALIESLIRFNCKKGIQKGLHLCAVSGIIPSCVKNEFNGKTGTMIAINKKKIVELINKSQKTIEKSFIEKYCYPLTFEVAKEMPRTSRKNMIFSYYNILINLGYEFRFYFLIDSQYDKDEISDDKKDMNTDDKKNAKKLPNNIKYIKKWRMFMKQEDMIKEQKNLMKKWKGFVKTFYDTSQMIKNITNKDQLESANTDEEIEPNIDKLDDEQVIEYSKSLLADLKSTVFQGVIQNYNEKSNLLDDVLDIIYSNENQKEIAKNVINDIITHQKNKSWNDLNTLKFSFLMKFSSSASYYKLFKFLNEKLPSPSTVESRFRPEILEREKLLTCANDIDILLDKYWGDVKNKVEVHLTEFNKKYSQNLSIDDYKIKICLGCDAASFTNFIKKQRAAKNDSKQKENNEIKHKIFSKLVEGDFDTSDIQEMMKTENNVSDEDSKYFFTMLIQPFCWKFPVSVIHLTKSINGHISPRESFDIFTLLKKINSHKHFEAHFFAADGETALDDLHEISFNKYKDEIDNLISGKITFEQFFQHVKSICYILPILDMFHAEKGGRNRIINNDIKLGEEEDNIITREKLKESLDVHEGVLDDKSPIGKMKDSYPIDLFQIKNSYIEYQKGSNSSGFYIFLYSIILEIFRNPYLELENRSDLTKIVLLILLFLYKESSNLPESTGFRKNSRSSNEYVWFTEKSHLMKLINTIIGIGIILDDPFASFELGLERISSHPEEQFFGRYRTHFFGNYSPKSAFRYAVRTSMALDFEKDLCISFSIPKRENYAGAHLDFNKNEDAFQGAEGFDLHKNIYDIALDLLYTGIGDKKELNELTDNFLISLLCFFEENQSFRNKEISSTKGSSIYPRIVANQI